MTNYLVSPASDGREEDLGGRLVPVQTVLYHNHLHHHQLETISHQLEVTLVLECLGLSQ